MIPEIVEKKLRDSLWARPANDRLNDAFSRLGIVESDDFAEFYCRFWGPFRSDSVGYELLDVIEQDETILSNTEIARHEFEFPSQFIVVSSLSAFSVLVYDTMSGFVYDVDFEGGELLLKAKQLPARWRSWRDFISDYFD